MIKITDIIVNKDGELDFTNDVIDALDIFMLGMGIPVDKYELEEIEWEDWYYNIHTLYLKSDYFIYNEDSDLEDDMFDEWISNFSDKDIRKYDCWDWIMII